MMCSIFFANTFLSLPEGVFTSNSNEFVARWSSRTRKSSRVKKTSRRQGAQRLSVFPQKTQVLLHRYTAIGTVICLLFGRIRSRSSVQGLAAELAGREDEKGVSVTIHGCANGAYSGTSSFHNHHY